MIIVLDVISGSIYDIPDEPGPKPTPTQLMKQELATLLSNYKADMQTCQQAWLTASVADGETEIAKKASIMQDLGDLKAEYLKNVSLIKAKYA